jgi:hypothetical protein
MRGLGEARAAIMTRLMTMPTTTTTARTMMVKLQAKPIKKKSLYIIDLIN